MKDLVGTYSVQEILLFIVTFALAIKGFVSFWDWGYARLRQIFKKETDEELARENIQSQVTRNKDSFQSLKERYARTEKEIEDILAKIDLLIESDKDDIKAFITEKHHFFCYKQKWIDDYTMDCIERRYKHYTDEGGNSFIHDLIEELRDLRRIPPTDDEEDK